VLMFHRAKKALDQRWTLGDFGRMKRYGITQRQLKSMCDWLKTH